MRFISDLSRWLQIALVVGVILVLPNAALTDTISVAPDSFCDDVTQISQIECEALVALYESTNGDDWSDNDGWVVAKTPCSWHGVGCEASRVDELDLVGNNLRGEIPPELGNLVNLLFLELDNNILVGSIPPELSNLSALRYLELNQNKLSGNIPPELGTLSNLFTLDLHDNFLSGAIPSELGKSSRIVLPISAGKSIERFHTPRS